MLCQQEESRHRDHEVVVKQFLDAIFSNQYPEQNKQALIAQCLSEHIRCNGFPEFNPQNRTEFSGFLNYLHDVFKQLTYCVEPLLFDSASVFTRFTIQGTHNEEFMGLAASGGTIRFTAVAFFKIHNNRIHEIVMYNKSVTLMTTKGHVYQLKKTD